MTRNEKAWFLEKKIERPPVPAQKAGCVIFVYYIFIMLVCSGLVGLLLYYGLPK